MLNDLDIIIPVHNISKRGFDRVFFSCYSLLQQKAFFNYIWVINSSIDREYAHLDTLLSKLPKVHHVHIRSNTFNKPRLLNTGIKLSDARWILCTDADYLFRFDLLKFCKDHRKDNRLLLKQVKMLPHIPIDKKRINIWDFPDAPINQFGKIADGALQYCRRDWLVKVGGYDERMIGLCGMDNDLHARAKRDGLEDYWVKESEILHMWHPIEKKMKISNQAVRNWKIRDKDKTIIRQTSLNEKIDN